MFLIDGQVVPLVQTIYKVFLVKTFVGAQVTPLLLSFKIIRT
jgi:hypothetical protein